MSARPRLGELVPVDVKGFRGSMHVRTDGPDDAPVLVLVHGFSASLHWYDRLVRLLADSLRLVRVDLIGHGATGGPSVDAPVQARAVGAVLDHLGVERATAVGHSFGADVAVELAQRSLRIQRLVIITQAPDYTDANLPRGHAIMTVPILAPVLHRGAHGLGTAVHVVLRRWPGQRENAELVAQALADFGAVRTGMFRVVLAQRRDRMSRYPLDVQVRDTGKPTLVVLGGRDHFYGARSAGRYEAAGAQVTILPDSGHSPLVDQPELIADLLRTFIARAAAGD